MTGAAEAGQPPVRVGCSIVDMCSGLHTTIGILAALHQRGATGPGQRVDTSMLATTAMLMVRVRDRVNPILARAGLTLTGPG